LNMFKPVIWNTGPAAMRARHNLRLRKKLYLQGAQAASAKRLKKNTIKK